MGLHYIILNIFLYDTILYLNAKGLHFKILRKINTNNFTGLLSFILNFPTMKYITFEFEKLLKMSRNFQFCKQ